MKKKLVNQTMNSRFNNLKNFHFVVILSISISFILCCSPGVVSIFQSSESFVCSTSFSSHKIYGTGQYSDGVIASGAKVEVVSSYGLLSDWIDANGEWSVNVGDPGPNWPQGTTFAIYGIGCCEHDGWTGGLQGVVSGEENNMGTIILYPNEPPLTPSTPQGPQHLLVGIEAIYTTSTTDPNYKHNIEYRFDWDAEGDHNYSQFSNTVPSGNEINMTHTWNEPGEYIIKAIARDDYGLKSSWSEGISVTIYASNQAPNTPEIIGITEGKKHHLYSFSLSCEDPDGQDVFYSVDWGDGQVDEWIGPYTSNEDVTLTHSWNEIGTYEISVRVKDIIGTESEEQGKHTLAIVGPKISITSVFVEPGHIKAEISNSGIANADNVTWSFSIDGGWLKSGRYTQGNQFIEGLSTVIVSSDRVFGFGFNLNIVFTVQMEQEDTIEWTESAFVILQYIFLKN